MGTSGTYGDELQLDNVEVSFSVNNNIAAVRHRQHRGV